MTLTQQIICDIIKYGMSLKEDQIWIQNQRRHIPEDKRLYIVVGMLASKSYGNNIEYDYSGITGVSGTTGTTGIAYDIMTQYVRETIVIDVFSYTTEALERYGEVFGVLNSTYSEEMQTTHAIRIGKTPISINDVSHVEGATLLNRMSLTLQVLRKYSNVIGTNYYDLSTQYVSVTGQ